MDQTKIEDQNRKDNATAPEESISFNLLNILSSVWVWRKQIGLMTTVITIGTLIVSFFLPTYYTAVSTFAPANEDKDLFSSQGKNNSMYGDEDALDRAIIFASSNQLIGYMIKEFKLDERYGINGSTPKGIDRIEKRFLKLYNLKKNEHGGIDISIQDIDPKMAARMLDAAIKKIDDLIRKATFPNKELMIMTYQGAMDEKRRELKMTSDSLFQLRKKYGIFDIAKQGELLAELLVETESQLAENTAKLESYKSKGGRPDSIINVTARVMGYQRKLQMLNAISDSINSSINLNLYNEGIEKILFFESKINNINRDIGEIYREYDKFRAQATSNTSALIIYEPVQIPKIKSWPIRSVLVIASMFLSLLLGLTGALLLDLNKRIDWKTIFK
jgi:capsule polysaccharide export protein KpsE/RkpR